LTFAQLLRLPVLSGLTALHTSYDQLDSACMHVLPLHLRGLRTLHLETPSRLPPTDSSFFAPLPMLPSLTDFSVVVRSDVACDPSAVGQCGGLRRLAVDSLALRDWLPALTAPALRRLESLTLRRLLVRSFTPHELASVFANLSGLQSLSLQRCYAVDELPPAALALCARLRSLCIQPESVDDPAATPAWSPARQYGSLVPSPDHLQRLLAALPAAAAVLELQLPPLPSGDDYEQRVHAQLSAWQQVHAQRVRLLVE
jgi:hypothetical protein